MRLISRNSALRLVHYFSAQLATQAANLVAGFAIVHLLDKSAFALYTLAVGILSTSSIISDAGLNNSLVYFKRSLGPEAFEQMSRTALWLRGVVLVAIIPPMLLVYSVLAIRQLSGTHMEAPFQTLMLSAGLLGLGIWANARASTLMTLARLDGRIAWVNNLEASAAIGRAIAIVGALMIGSAFQTQASVLVGLFPTTASLMVLAYCLGVPMRDAPTGEDRAKHIRSIRHYVRPQILSAAYFAFQSQVVTFLAAIVGGGGALADVGALARINALFGIAIGFLSSSVLPRMATVRDDREYREQYKKYLAAYAAYGVVATCAAWMAPKVFLMLLGQSYSQLNEELVLSVASLAIVALGSLAQGVNNARSWTRFFNHGLFLFILAQCVFLACFNVGSTRGLLLFNLFTAFVGALIQFGFNWLGFAGRAHGGLGKNEPGQ